MKYLTIILLCCLCCLGVEAEKNSNKEQNEQPEIENPVVTVSYQNLEDPRQNYIKTLEKNRSELDSINKKLKDEIDSKNRLIEKKKNLLPDVQKKSSNSDLQFVDIVANFNFIPYNESYERVGRAALAVVSPENRRKYKDRCDIFDNYKTDIYNVTDFITKCEKTLEPTIQPSALEGKDRRRAKELLQDLKNSEVYNRYKAYEEYKDTYLGDKIVKVENFLQKSSNSGVPGKSLKTLSSIRTELEGLVNKKTE